MTFTFQYGYQRSRTLDITIIFQMWTEKVVLYLIRCVCVISALVANMDIPLPGEEFPVYEIEPPDIPMPDDPPISSRNGTHESKVVVAESTLSEPSQEDPDDVAPPLPQTDSSEFDDPNR